MTAPMGRDEQAAFYASRDASLLTDAARAEHEATWGPRLREGGLDPYGNPLPPGEPASPLEELEDIPLDLPTDREPPRDWAALGVVVREQRDDSVAVDLLDFLAQGDDDEAEEWFVRGLIPKRSFTIVGGHPKSGKTLFVLDLGMASATGREFLGRETAQATFLFVTEEGSPVETRKRFARLVRSYGEPARDAVRLIYRRGTRFDDPSSWQWVRDELARIGGPTLLVLDPLRDLLVGDENDSTTISRVNDAIRAVLRDFSDVTVILLHHLSKTRGDGQQAGMRLRGSGAIPGASDAMLILDADPIPDDAEGEVPLKGKLTIQSRIAAGARYWWRWDNESGQFIEAEAEARTVADKAAQFLAEHGPATLAQIAEELETTPDSVRVSLSRDRSRFRVTQGVGPQDPSTWAVTE